MTGVGQLVGEGGRVRGDAPLGRVGRADDGDAERGGVPRRHTPSLDLTTRSDSRASVPIIIPVTTSRIVLAGK